MSATYSSPEEMSRNEYHFTSRTWGKTDSFSVTHGVRISSPILIGKIPVSEDPRSRSRCYCMENINTSRSILAPLKKKILQTQEPFALHGPE
jgi:hypothetical protein